MIVSPVSLKSFKYIWYCLWTQNSIKLRLHLIVSIVAILLSIGLTLSVPFFLKQVVMGLSNQSNFFALPVALLIISYGLIWCFAQMMEVIREMAILKPQVAATNNFSMNLFIHLQALSIRYHMDRRTGGILSAYKQIGWAYPEIIRLILCVISPVVIEVVLAIFILSYYYSISFGLGLLVMFVLYNLLSYYTSDSIVLCRKIQNECSMEANGCIVDSLLNAETVKLFNSQDYETDRTLRYLKALEDADFNMLNADAKIHLIQNIIIGFTIIFMTLFAGFQVFQNKINVSDFILIYGYLIMFMSPLSTLGYSIRLLRKYFTRTSIALDILDKPIEITDIPSAAPLRINKGNIVFKDVSFGYNADREILHNVSFEVPAGKTVAIVGATGSGKSTISRLLFRLYNLNAGKIFIDGQDVSQVIKSSLRENIGIVPQDAILFNDTIYSNIAYGNPNCSAQDVMVAINGAELNEVIEKLPNQLETIVGERGLKLSGGEKQRVAIARMLIKKPKIMVFDEATSSLDVHTEQLIQRNIRVISKDITTIIIAHRLSTITYADIILVFQDGTIMESGTHAELLALGGLYFDLWNHQLEQSSHS